MLQVRYFVVLIFISSNFLTAQSPGDKISGYDLLELSNPNNLSPPVKDAFGFPSRAPDLNVLPGFQNPPHGYGQVPFWWWTGDPLDKDRLLWQIEELHSKGINGMQVNYSHTKEEGWPTDLSEPELFSKEWWDIWKFVAEECSKRNMGIGLSGYTIDWPKPYQNADNLFNRIIYSIPEINGQTIVIDTTMRIKAGTVVSISVSEKSIGVWAYPMENGKLCSGGTDLQKYVNNSKLIWTPEQGNWVLYVFGVKSHPGTINPINSLAGKTVIDNFFQRFQDNTVDKTSTGLNYFFQDELRFGVGDLIWIDDFNDEFKRLKGYDVFEILPALFRDMCQITAKARLDFMDVKVHLSEERYFKPIFDWHWSRGMIYGCDPGSRGKDPAEFGDYFRAVRWYTAPGHDTPGGNADLIKGKVSSSIASLYKRPRVWLEGYHSLGWGATPERLMYATSENYLYGCNLLNLHGLYYTTHGSFWEWAPPSYHFRMPYWDHFGKFLMYFERLSYLLSQGVLQADIAILYPTSTIQAEMISLGESDFHNTQGILSVDSRRFTKTAFESGTEFFNNGYDFIFIDHQSLARAEIGNKQFSVSDASYKVLVLPSMNSVRWSTVQQALKFFRAGGIVMAVESLPIASDRIGNNDPKLDAAIKEIFGLTGADINPGIMPGKNSNAAGGIGMLVQDADQLRNEIETLLPRHVASDIPVRAMHRKIGEREVYMVMGNGKDVNCIFLSKGKVEKWNPWSGEVTPLYMVNETKEGTSVKLTFQPNQAEIIVFTPAQTEVQVISTQLDEITNIKIDKEKTTVTGYSRTSGLSQTYLNINGEIQLVTGNIASVPDPIILDGDWEFELKPTMNNQWGDFRLPVTEKIIGAEARIFNYTQEVTESKGWESPNYSDTQGKRVTYGYGQKFWKIGPLPAGIDYSSLEKELSSAKILDPTKPVIVNGKFYGWESYQYSWRMGIEGDPGDQKGYHGLKERISNDFIRLDNPIEGNNNGIFYLWTSAYVPGKTKAIQFAGNLKPSAVFLNNKKVSTPHSELSLKAGHNPLLLRYDQSGRTHYVLESAGATVPGDRTPLSMKWWDMSERIIFDANPAIKNPAGWYRFNAPPGLSSMTLRTMGEIKVWVDGKAQDVQVIKQDYPAVYKVVLEASIPEKALVAVRVEQARGFYEGSAFPEPILLDCVAGISQPGNWSEGTALECYSGGAWYRKSISLTKEHLNSKVILHLGEEVIATAEVRVNGETAGVLVAAPWSLDISTHVKEGENNIEILVYNTLTNHYKTIPTKYNTDKTQKSGLLGPVQLEFSSKIVLTQLRQ